MEAFRIRQKLIQIEDKKEIKEGKNLKWFEENYNN